MKNKNQKEIDMIVGELKSYGKILRLDSNRFKDHLEDLATSILTKLKENEIVLARGKVERIYEHNFKGRLKDCPTECYIDNKSLEEIMPEYLEGKTIELTAGVMKDE